MERDLFSIGVPFIAGGVVFLLLALGTGIVSTRGATRAEIAHARIDERAAVCFDAASAHLAERGHEPGIDSGKEKQRLAQQFMVATGNGKTDALIQEECSKKLGA